MVSPVSGYKQNEVSTQNQVSSQSLSHLFPKSASDSALSQHGLKRQFRLSPETKFQHLQKSIHHEIFLDIRRSLEFRQREHMNEIIASCEWLAHDPEGKEYLGYVCFLCEYNYAELLHASQDKMKLRMAFNNGLYHLLKPLIDLEENHKKVGLQDPQKVSITMFPRLIAEAIVSGPNICNSGIIRQIKENFNGSLPFHRHLQFVLTALENYPHLRHKVRSIEAPKSQDSPVSEIIRVTLGRRITDAVSIWDAQKTALSALLTDLRQGRVGSCFATYLAINQINSRLASSLDDFRELILSSCLTRQNKCYPALLEISFHYRDKAFIISKEGKLENDCYVWESPGLIASCLAADISRPKEAISKVIEDLYRDVPENYLLVTNPDLLLKQVIKKEVPYKDDHLLKRSLMAFESQTNHLLLRIWETTIANMAESDELGYATHLLFASVLSPLQQLIPEQYDLFEDIFCTMLGKRVKFLYDSHVKQRVISADDNCYFGAFILFDGRESLNTQGWLKINHAEQFAEFIADVIRSCPYPNQKTKEWLIKQVSEPIFVENVIQVFRENYSDDMNSTPWQISAGNDPSVVYNKYFEKTISKNRELQVLDAEHLLVKMITMMRENQGTLKKHLYAETAFTLPLYISEFHACLAELTNPYLLAALNDPRCPEDWVQEMLYQPCRKIWQQEVSGEKRSALVAYASVSIVGPEQWKEYFNAVLEIPDGLNLVEFRNALLGCMRVKDTLKLDNFIFQQILTVEERKLLVQHFIKFVDTIWEDSSIYHVHMGFMINPGTGQLELWKMRSDGIAIPTDQIAWCHNKTYTFVLD